jgi:hypothetical protein
MRGIFWPTVSRALVYVASVDSSSHSFRKNRFNSRRAHFETTYRFNGDHFGVFPCAMASNTLEKTRRNNNLFHIRQLKIVVGESWVGCFVAANGGTENWGWYSRNAQRISRLTRSRVQPAPTRLRERLCCYLCRRHEPRLLPNIRLSHAIYQSLP